MTPSTLVGADPLADHDGEQRRQPQQTQPEDDDGDQDLDERERAPIWSGSSWLHLHQLQGCRCRVDREDPRLRPVGAGHARRGDFTIVAAGVALDPPVDAGLVTPVTSSARRSCRSADRCRGGARAASPRRCRCGLSVPASRFVVERDLAHGPAETMSGLSRPMSRRFRSSVRAERRRQHPFHIVPLLSTWSRS